ncbi:hypothetical protein ACLOJK_032591 [Asimina triloba]
MIETAAETGIEGRIINVSSVIHTWVKREAFHFNDMLNPISYNGTSVYAQSKLANILHAREVSRQLKLSDHVICTPADSVFFLASKLLKSTGQGASTTCYVALSPKMNERSGKYYADCNESPSSSLANDETLARQLWKQTQKHHYTLAEMQNREPSLYFGRAPSHARSLQNLAETLGKLICMSSCNRILLKPVNMPDINKDSTTESSMGQSIQVQGHCHCKEQLVGA